LLITIVIILFTRSNKKSWLWRDQELIFVSSGQR